MSIDVWTTCQYKIVTVKLSLHSLAKGKVRNRIPPMLASWQISHAALSYLIHFATNPSMME